jgi:hypothetical protein
MMMERSRQRAVERGHKVYVRGYRKGVSHWGAWSYGLYSERFPKIDRDWSIYNQG